MKSTTFLALMFIFLMTFFVGLVGGFEIARRSPACWIK